MKKYLSIIQRFDLYGVEGLPIKYTLAFGVGIAVGFKLISPTLVGIAELAVLGICLVKCLQKNVTGFLCWLPYAMYTEIFVRKKVEWLPYLTMQHFFIAASVIMLFNGARGKRLHFTGMPIIVLFGALEIINNIYPNKVVVSRAIIIQTMSVMSLVVWASYTIFSPAQVLKFLTHLKIAGVYLTGIILVAHLTGGIDYGHQSSSEASNGLAPVQLSGYLGVICSLFFLSVMNKEESSQYWMNIVLLVLVSSIMVLTFSRGGVYFVVAVIGIYFFYNRSKAANYFKFFLLIPIAGIVYYSVVETTGGKIVERYELEGSSGRDKLVKVAFVIFSDHLLTGIGTGNFNTEIIKKNLYAVESGAHNEFARVAAEHGIIGIFLYWGFFVYLFLDIRKRSQPSQQYAMFFLVLFCLITIHNGLKISIQPVLVMLAVSISSVQYIKRKPFLRAPIHAAEPVV